MSHLTNPNTKRLATDCCICGIALCDSKSVELGIGPTCRKNTGFNATYKALTDRQRKNVNKLIHAAGVACEAGEIDEVLALADKIEKRGFDQVANAVRNRFVSIRLHRATVEEFGWTSERGEFSLGKQHDVVRLWTPYSPAFNSARRVNRLRGRPCKVKTDHGKFHWEIKVEHSVLLLRVLATVFPGKPYICDKGVLKVPTAKEFNEKFVGGHIAPIPAR